VHNQRDLELLLRSRVPLVVIETQDELRLLDLLKLITLSGVSEKYVPSRTGTPASSAEKVWASAGSSRRR